MKKRKLMLLGVCVLLMSGILVACGSEVAERSEEPEDVLDSAEEYSITNYFDEMVFEDIHIPDSAIIIETEEGYENIMTLPVDINYVPASGEDYDNDGLIDIGNQEVVESEEDTNRQDDNVLVDDENTQTIATNPVEERAGQTPNVASDWIDISVEEWPSQETHIHVTPELDYSMDYICEESNIFFGEYIIHTVSVDLQTSEFDDTLEQLHNLTRRYNGFPEHISVGNWGDALSQENNTKGRWASFTIRIPTESYKEMLNRIHELGNLSFMHVSTEDVTLQVRDVNTQLESLSVREEQIVDLMDNARGDDLLLAELELNEVGRQMQSVITEGNTLHSQVAYSTFQIFITEVMEMVLIEEPILNEPIPSDARNAFNASLSALRTLGDGLFIIIAAIIPWVVVFGGITLLAVFVVRRGANKVEK